MTIKTLISALALTVVTTAASAFTPVGEPVEGFTGETSTTWQPMVADRGDTIMGSVCNVFAKPLLCYDEFLMVNAEEFPQEITRDSDLWLLEGATYVVPLQLDDAAATSPVSMTDFEAYQALVNERLDTIEKNLEDQAASFSAAMASATEITAAATEVMEGIRAIKDDVKVLDGRMDDMVSEEEVVEIAESTVATATDSLNEGLNQVLALTLTALLLAVLTAGGGFWLFGRQNSLEKRTAAGFREVNDRVDGIELRQDMYGKFELPDDFQDQINDLDVDTSIPVMVRCKNGQEARVDITKREDAQGVFIDLCGVRSGYHRVDTLNVASIARTLSKAIEGDRVIGVSNQSAQAA